MFNNPALVKVHVENNGKSLYLMFDLNKIEHVSYFQQDVSSVENSENEDESEDVFISDYTRFKKELKKQSMYKITIHYDSGTSDTYIGETATKIWEDFYRAGYR